MSGWTEERIATLTRMWNERFATSEIALTLRITRDAVLGKVHRLGLPSRGQSKNRRRVGTHVITKPNVSQQWSDADIATLRRLHAENAQTSAIAIILSRSTSAVNTKLSALELKRPPEYLATAYKHTPRSIDVAPTKPGNARRDLDPEQPGPDAVTIDELRHHHCRWPVGDAADSALLYCGAHSPLDKPYCSAHSARAHRASAPLTNLFNERRAA